MTTSGLSELYLVAHSSIEIRVVRAQFHRTISKDAAGAYRHRDTGTQLHAEGTQLCALDAFARSGALGLPGAGHGLAACLGGDLSKPEWCFVRWLQFGQNLVELAHGVCPGHTDILVLEHEEIAIPRPGLCLLRSAQVQLGQCLLIGQMVALGFEDDYLIRPRRKKKRSFPFTPLGKLRKLGKVTLSVVDF